MRVEIFILGYLFVFFKAYVPVLLIHGWQNPHNGFPFGNGKTGARYPGDAP